MLFLDGQGIGQQKRPTISTQMSHFPHQTNSSFSDLVEPGTSIPLSNSFQTEALSTSLTETTTRFFVFENPDRHHALEAPVQIPTHSAEPQSQTSPANQSCLLRLAYPLSQDAFSHPFTQNRNHHERAFPNNK